MFMKYTLITWLGIMGISSSGKVAPNSMEVFTPTGINSVTIWINDDTSTVGNGDILPAFLLFERRGDRIADMSPVPVPEGKID
jgi:hypothetical protein